jgi:hypothetical protein
VLLPSIATFDAKIAALFAAHPDAELFAALPGAGPHLSPRLLVAFGEERTRYSTAQDLLRYSGIAPVNESRRSASSAEPRSEVVGSLAVELSQVFATNVCRMGTTKPSVFIVGRGVLPDATEKRKDASGSNSSFSV